MSVSAGTSKVYDNAMADYREFAQRRGLVEEGELILPTEFHLIGFAVWLAERGTGPSGITERLRGVGLWTQSFTGTDPRLDLTGSMRPTLARVMTGIRREHSRRRPLREALTADRLRTLLYVLRALTDIPAVDRAMYEAALCLGVFGLCRCKVLVHPGTRQRSATGPQRRDVTRFREPGTDGPTRYFEFFIRKAKMDPEARGATIKLFATGGDFCPVRAMDRYLKMAPRRGPTAVLFQHADGSYLTRDRVNRMIKRLSELAGFDPARYSTHSMRAGGATTLSLLGARPYVIKQLGRWTSDAYMLYIRMPDHQLIELQRGMARIPALAADRATQAVKANTAWAQLRPLLHGG
jgi:hypothetical protein